MASCSGGNSGSFMLNMLSTCGFSASYFSSGKKNGSEDSKEEEEKEKSRKRRRR